MQEINQKTSSERLVAFTCGWSRRIMFVCSEDSKLWTENKKLMESKWPHLMGLSPDGTVTWDCHGTGIKVPTLQRKRRLICVCLLELMDSSSSLMEMILHQTGAVSTSSKSRTPSSTIKSQREETEVKSYRRKWLSSEMVEVFTLSYF